VTRVTFTELAYCGPQRHDGAAMRRLGLLITICLAALVCGPLAASAVDLTVAGTVTGELARGRRVTFRITATHPQGWQNLQTVSVVLSLRTAPLEELEYIVDSTTIRAGISSALSGTGDSVRGRFFEVSAPDVEVSTGGNRLELTFAAKLLDDVPEGARFEFSVVDDVGQEASIRRVAAISAEEEGFPWGTLALAIAAALVAGGFLGSRVTAHRRPASRSIYQDVARRILEERDRPTGKSGG
jgi:hypothetical protein